MSTEPLFGEDVMEEIEKGVEVKSGPYQEKFLPQIMFIDPVWIEQQFSIREKKLTEESTKNKLHRGLEEILERGERVRPKRKCLVCGDGIKIFSIRESSGIRVGPDYTTCGKDWCKHEIMGGTEIKTEIYKFKFSVLRKLQRRYSKVDFKEVSKLFQWAFGVSAYEKEVSEPDARKAYKVFYGLSE